MATTTHQLSWEAFEQLPDDGMHHELIEGELQTLPPPKLLHSKVARSRKVRVFSNDGAICERGIQDSLTLPGILDDWNLSVAPLFEHQ